MHRGLTAARARIVGVGSVGETADVEREEGHEEENCEEDEYGEGQGGVERRVGGKGWRRRSDGSGSLFIL